MSDLLKHVFLGDLDNTAERKQELRIRERMFRIVTSYDGREKKGTTSRLY
jgi:hypothetical protein